VLSRIDSPNAVPTPKVQIVTASYRKKGEILRRVEDIKRERDNDNIFASLL